MSRRAIAAGAVLALMLALAGCTQASDLDDGLDGAPDGDYVSADGSVQTFASGNREDAISFSGETDTGATVSSDDLAGDIVVLNFWYANCSPCRREAPDLQALNDEFADRGVVFLGVNIRDSADKARAFAEEFGVTYSSILDAEGRDVTSAFAGEVPPSAVPTTLVLDAEGRVAAQFTGLISSRTTLADVIEAILAEGT